MIRLSRAVPLVLLAAASAVGACRRQPEVETSPTPAGATDEQRRADAIAAAERRRAEEAAAAERRRADSIAAAEAERNRLMGEARSALGAVIYFDFDRADLSDASRATLDAKLPLMTANAGMRVRITGHADSRGSDEYNLALGQRRAAAAKRYLTDRGIDAGRIDVASRGEESPACPEENETCYAQNRRDEFEIVAGGESLTLPRPGSE